jgi:PilZ domain-containing protein
MNIERRFKSRYPLELNVRYHTFGKSTVISGEGRTVNLSSSGMLVASSDKMSDGMRLKLTIEWPSLLNGTTPLQLVTFGRVVRSDASGFAVAMEHYQFRTMKRRTDLTVVPATRGLAMPVDSPRNVPAALTDRVLEAVSPSVKSSS